MEPVAALCSDDPVALARVYAPEILERLAAETRLLPGRLGSADLARPTMEQADVEALFSTWGMPVLDQRALEALPRLRAVFYAAGSVRAFARPLLEKGVAVFCAAEANARPTAEFSLANILLAQKRALPASAALRRQGTRAWAVPEGRLGSRGAEVALLGAGRVGRALIRLLKPFELKVLVFDPFLTGVEARDLGVERVDLAEAFRRGQTVSNHLADVPDTRGLITEGLLRSMRPHATFLNTGRGATVDEAGLWAALRARPDLCAVLDVLQAEPPAPGSPALALDNVFLTPHLAGSLGDEWGRLAEAMLEAFGDWRAGRPSRHQVGLDMLEAMA